MFNSSLRNKLAFSFAAVAALFLIAIGLGVIPLATVGDDTAASYRKAVLAEDASARAYNMRISAGQDAAAHKLILNPDGTVMHAGDIADFKSSLSQLQHAASSSSDRAALGRIGALFSSWQQADAYGQHLWQTAQYRASSAWENGTANSRGDALSQGLFDYSAAAQKAAKAEKDSAISSSQILMSVLSVAALALGAVIVVLLTRSITRRVGVLVERVRELSAHGVASLGRGLQAMSRGDLTVGAQSEAKPIENAGSGEIGHLSQTLNEMLGQVHAGVQTLQHDPELSSRR